MTRNFKPSHANIAFPYSLMEQSEAAARRYSSKWVFIKISQHSEENISVGVS